MWLQFVCRLVGNPVCMESGVTEKICSLPENTTPSDSRQSNKCVPMKCSHSLQIMSPNCRCAFPYTGNLFFRASRLSEHGISTDYDSLRDSMISSFQMSQLPVDSVAFGSPSKTLDDYLVINLHVFPSDGDETFDRNGINGIGWSLSNQTFKPPPDFGTYVFKGDDYEYFLGT